MSALPSERDQNFLLESRSGERFVLKIANALEDPAFLEAQHQVLGRLAGEGSSAPASSLADPEPSGNRDRAGVIKIRPPMPFSERDADLLVGTLDCILTEYRADER